MAHLQMFQNLIKPTSIATAIIIIITVTNQIYLRIYNITEGPPAITVNKASKILSLRVYLRSEGVLLTHLLTKRQKTKRTNYQR
jgi:hypothetical protein